MGYTTHRSRSTPNVIIRFKELHVARLFYVMFQGYAQNSRGRAMTIKLENCNMRRAVQDNPGAAINLKNLPKVQAADLDAIFLPRITGGDGMAAIRWEPSGFDGGRRYSD